MIDGFWVKYVFAGNLRVAKIVGGVVTYFHKDHLGSSTVMTDGSGNVVESGAYLPYGGQRGSSSISGSGYTFTDQELDGESGLFNYDARLYDPVVGRFITADPIVGSVFNPKDLNRFAYVFNNPLLYTDPSGYVEVIGNRPNEIDPYQGTADRGTYRDLEYEYDKDDTRYRVPKTEWRIQRGYEQRASPAYSVGVFAGLIFGSGITAVLGEALAIDGIFVLGDVYRYWDSDWYEDPNAPKRTNPLDGTTFTDKVKRQMEGKDLDHNFPTLIDKQADAAKVKKITGGDGIERTKVELPGSINGKDGNFSWIIEPDKTVNHRQFERLRKK